MINPLTSLRFIFAFLVFMSHCILFDKTQNPFLHHLFFEGFIGVNFFFTLSGFILAYNYQKKLSEKIVTRKTFYISRFARIYPIHLITMLLCVLMFRASQIDQSYITNLIANIFLLQSFYPMEGVKFNDVSWSLSNEIFFYLLFPFLITWYFKSKKIIYSLLIFICVAMIILMFIYADTDWELWLFYRHPVARLIDFSLGIILYNMCINISVEKWIRRINSTILEIGSILIVIAFYCFSFFIPLLYRHAIWYWIPTCILIGVFFFQRGQISRILSNRWLVLLGEISFSFYMIHKIVLRYTERFFIVYYPENSFHLSIIFALSLVITIALSYLSFKYIEIPSNKYLKKALL